MDKGASATQTGPSQVEPVPVSPLRASVPSAGLLPCPFCGGPAHLDAAEVDDSALEPEDQEVTSWCIGCSCAAFIGPYSTENAVIAAWNARAAAPDTTRRDAPDFTPVREMLAAIMDEATDGAELYSRIQEVCNTYLRIKGGGGND